jgi:hypothetical protein
MIGRAVSVLVLAVAVSTGCVFAQLWIGEEPIRVVLEGRRETEVAPHGSGNVYAPEVMVEDGRYRMWYGGQGRDGHDRVHYADSKDGLVWTRRGVVLDRGTANHVNDPTVVKIHDIYYMYYTVSETDIVDRIALATSKDGLAWEPRGVVIGPGPAGAWDSLLAGRPAVIHEDGTFKLWYDGRKDLPMGAPAANVPKSPRSMRSVGLATSTDGIRWTKHPGNPVFGNDADAVDVKRLGSRLVMVYESHGGTRGATSIDGLSWKDRGLILARTGLPLDASGHVTPFLLVGGKGADSTLFFGVAPKASWNYNAIARAILPATEIEKP